MKRAEFNYREGFSIAPAAAPGDFLTKAPYIDHGTDPIDKTRYFSSEYMEKEWEQMWTKIWVLAGVESDLPEVGDFVTFDLRHESFLIVRGEDNAIHAYSNVCQHRGLRLVQAEFGSVANGFTCPFHSWSYSLDGKVANITDKETFRSETICHNPRLPEIGCDVLAGFIFITMNESPPPLAEFMGVFGEHLRAYEPEKRVVVRHTSVELEANWKDGVDAFLEGYHFHAIHNQVLPVIDDYHVQQDLYPGGIARLIIPQLTPSPRLGETDSLSEGLKAVMSDSGIDPASFTGAIGDIRHSAQLAKRARAAELGVDYSGYADSQLTDSYVYSLFPNVIMGAHPEAISAYRFLPHKSDPGKMYFDTMTLYYPVKQTDGSYAIPNWMGVSNAEVIAAEGHRQTERFAIGDDYSKIGLLYEQDADMMPLVHSGMRSRYFKGAILGEQEVRIRHFHAELDRYINGEK